jgi:hypothetical protein
MHSRDNAEHTLVTAAHPVTAVLSRILREILRYISDPDKIIYSQLITWPTVSTHPGATVQCHVLPPQNVESLHDYMTGDR